MKKQQFGIVRNGEHIEAGFTNRTTAETKIEEMKANDLRMAAAGWCSVESAKATRYFVEEIKGRVW